MWQSMLAEQLGKSMAERGGIGISDRILRDYYMRGDEKVPIEGVSQAEPTAESRAMMSTALVQEIQRKITQSLSEDRAQSATLSSR
jgi:Rod binding domain-containing protein